MKRPEQQLQKAACAFIDRAAPWLLYFHPANGGARSKAEAGIFKAMGVKAGVPDLVILLPEARVGFLEFKAKGGSLSPSQKIWRHELQSRGYPWAEVRSLEEVETTLSEWLAPHGLKLRATTTIKEV